MPHKLSTSWRTCRVRRMARVEDLAGARAPGARGTPEGPPERSCAWRTWDTWGEQLARPREPGARGTRQGGNHPPTPRSPRRAGSPGAPRCLTARYDLHVCHVRQAHERSRASHVSHVRQARERSRARPHERSRAWRTWDTWELESARERSCAWRTWHTWRLIERSPTRPRCRIRRMAHVGERGQRPCEPREARVDARVPHEDRVRCRGRGSTCRSHGARGIFVSYTPSRCRSPAPGVEARVRVCHSWVSIDEE